MKIIKVEEWEQNHINSLTIKLIFAATAATLFATALDVILRHSGVAAIRPELLFAPWSIALVIGTGLSFHRGVLAERERAAEEKEKADKPAA